MIFFVGNDGTIVKSLPSPVYEGAANANTIYLIAPFAQNLAVTMSFRLPNGVVWTPPEPMTKQTELAGIINEKTGKTYAGWTYAIPNEITRHYGTVTAQFFFHSAQEGVVIPTSSTSFTVGRGVPSELPTEPEADVYDKILEAIAQIQEDVDNGYYPSRGIYAWTDGYVYGANEIVYYPYKGEYGAIVKSLTDNNTTEPYTDGILNGEWVEIRDFNIPQGPAGPQGPEGPQGPQGERGAAGANGRSFVISGQADSVSDLPVPTAQYLGDAFFVGTEEPRDVYACVEYNGVLSWENQGPLQGPQGEQGIQGPTGNGISSYSVTYQSSTSGTTIPTGTWSTSIPSVSQGSYLWTRTVLTFTNGSSSTSYSVARMGNDATVTVDTALSSTSTNPVQNKVINAALTNGSVTKVGTATKGSSTQPIYLNAGTPTACSRTIPSITLNGSPNSTPSFYAPTVDTGGRWLRATGLGEPEWSLPINIHDSYTEISSNQTVPDLGVGHTGVICYFTSSSSTFTIYLPSSGEWAFAYQISNSYYNGAVEQFSSAKSVAWRNSAVSGGNAMCSIKGNGKYTSIMIIYTRTK